MQIERISAQKAKELVDAGAVIIDIRSQGEYDANHIDGSCCKCVTDIQGANALADCKGKVVIFSCLSGMRTMMAAKTLEQCASNAGCKECYILDGGYSGWKRAGLPTVDAPNAPISIMRQVQLTAGSLVAIGAILGFAVNINFIFLSLFVGLGLMYAGISGTCAMAKLLAAMPWNKDNEDCCCNPEGCKQES